MVSVILTSGDTDLQSSKELPSVTSVLLSSIVTILDITLAHSHMFLVPYPAQCHASH
jgi:hypothetical protein